MKLLLLAGTGEARRIASALSPKFNILASLAGATRGPVEMTCPVRIGGFGGPEGFRDYLKTENIGAVLDATHPFAGVMSHTAATICKSLGLPHVQLLRPAWVPGAGDDWYFIDRAEDAASIVSPNAVVFLATGRQTLPGFANLRGRRLICRQIDPPDRPFPYENGQYLVGRPPFSVEDEVSLFRDLGVNVLIVKNSGGGASRSKLDAARLLGIPVILLNRPVQPDCSRVQTVEEAIVWVERLFSA